MGSYPGRLRRNPYIHTTDVRGRRVKTTPSLHKAIMTEQELLADIQARLRTLETSLLGVPGSEDHGFVGLVTDDLRTIRVQQGQQNDRIKDIENRCAGHKAACEQKDKDREKESVRFSSARSFWVSTALAFLALAISVWNRWQK